LSTRHVLWLKVISSYMRHCWEWKINPTWCGLIATPLCLALFRFVFDIVSTRIEWQRRSGYKTNCLHVAASSIDTAKHKTGDDGGFCCWWYSTLALFLSCRGPLLQLYRHCPYMTSTYMTCPYIPYTYVTYHCMSYPYVPYHYMH
jgi:hypothetical protein